MAQIIDPVPSYLHDRIVCCYVNATSKIQIARITNIPNWYFERVVFPGQHLIFEALPEALLEIHSGMMASAILSDTILCDRLRMEQNNSETHQRQDTEKIQDPYEPNTWGTTHKNPTPTPSLKTLTLSAAE